MEIFKRGMKQWGGKNIQFPQRVDCATVGFQAPPASHNQIVPRGLPRQHSLSSERSEWLRPKRALPCLALVTHWHALLSFFCGPCPSKSRATPKSQPTSDIIIPSLIASSSLLKFLIHSHNSTEESVSELRDGFGSHLVISNLQQASWKVLEPSCNPRIKNFDWLIRIFLPLIVVSEVEVNFCWNFCQISPSEGCKPTPFWETSNLCICSI